MYVQGVKPWKSSRWTPPAGVVDQIDTAAATEGEKEEEGEHVHEDSSKTGEGSA